MCNHAYGLEIIRCQECGAHVASRCGECGYEARYDEHAPGCPRALSRAPTPEGPDSSEAVRNRV